jgi:hypothetical protein
MVSWERSFEFVCQENNLAPELIMGEDRMPVETPRFIPNESGASVELR